MFNAMMATLGFLALSALFLFVLWFFGDVASAFFLSW